MTDFSHHWRTMIVETETMVDRVDDWSGVRSPSRARRRMKYGHRQNVTTIETPRKDAVTLDGGRTFYMHPVTAAVFRRELAQAARGAGQ